jgi:hypothetical protein
MDYRYIDRHGALNDAEAFAGPPSGDGRLAMGGGVRRIRPEVIELVPEAMARELRVVPLASEGETITLLAADPDDIEVIDKLTFVLNRRIRFEPASSDEIDRLIEAYYPGSGDGESVDSMLQEFTDTAVSHSMAPLPALGEDDDFDFDAKPWAGHRPSASAWAARLRGQPRALAAMRSRLRPGPMATGIDATQPLGGPTGMFRFTVEEGLRVLMRRPDGTMDVVVGPMQVWRGRNVFRPMAHHVAHPGDYLIIRYRDGRQEHLPGPSEVWFDPRVHQAIEREEALQLAAKEAVVVYSQKEGTGVVQRRVEYGPALFIPRPGEWLHTFSWHASKGGSKGVVKVPNGLVFQKLWLMPDQMYHDVTDVRTADDAVLTIRLMIFFELVDIDRMLDATHDPIGDFVNAASSDVVDFTGRHDFESFKHNTDRLNELDAYRQLSGRAGQCGYRINKVVYRGYGAAERLQEMHDQAIEARTRLQLDRATEQQSQDLENFRLDSQLARAGKRRSEQTSEVAHDLEIASRKHEARLRGSEAASAADRERRRLDAEQRRQLRALEDARQREHLAALRELGVDLTAYLTQGRADRVIELRGGGGNGATHVHLEPGPRPSRPGAGAGA